VIDHDISWRPWKSHGMFFFSFLLNYQITSEMTGRNSATFAGVVHILIRLSVPIPIQYQADPFPYTHRVARPLVSLATTSKATKCLDYLISLVGDVRPMGIPLFIISTCSRSANEQPREGLGCLQRVRLGRSRMQPWAASDWCCDWRNP
jgi:hypothetical protein